jgi:threonyl-tRNA synthetase
MNIEVTFPDGNKKSYPSGSTAIDIAKQLSNSLAKRVLAAEVNGEVWDSFRAITNDCTLKLLTWDDTNGKSTFWHSSAHLMAEALESLYSGVKFGIGPPIEHGFYYDVDLGGQTLSANDLQKIEKKMQELANQNNAFIRKDIGKARSNTIFYR